MTTVKSHFRTNNIVLPSDVAYNIVMCSRITGDLDVEKLKKAWYTVKEKIPDLNNGLTPVQEKNFNTEVDGLSYIRELINMPFNLKIESNPERVSLIKAGNIWYFLIIQHHIKVDLFSKNLLSKSISGFYNDGKVDIGFVSYSEKIESEQNDKQKKFWEGQLSIPVEPLQLAIKKERSVFDGKGRTLFFPLDIDCCEKLNYLERDSHLQPFLLLLTCYAVLLSKLSGQREFYIGVPFSNRRETDRFAMYGPFVNILPVKASISESDTFQSLYSKLRKEMLILHRNQEYPFLDISRLYKGIRDSRIPFFIQAGFTREEPFNLKLNNLMCEPVEIRPDGAQMDLFMTYWQDNNELKIRWEYNTNAFELDQIVGWHRYYENLIKIASIAPDSRISKISILDKTGFNIVKDIYKSNEREYPVGIPLREHLINSYKKNLDEVAIKDSEQSLSYNAFASRVFKFSSYFQTKIGEGQKIAVILRNSINRTVLIHSIVCSGNVYIPIDPVWPKKRIEYIFKNADISLAVIESAFDGVLDDDFKQITLESLDRFSNLEFNPLSLKQKPHDPIAILYTSGSTGNPKGVNITGDGLVNRLFWMQEAYPLNPGDSLLHKVPYTFDVSLWEIFWPFLNGANLFIPEPGKYLDDNYLSKTLKERKITYVHFVPSLLRKFLENAEHTHLPDLKAVICSGEALEPDLLKKYYELIGEKPLYNLYGPTEASIDVTAWKCSEKDLDNGRIPIGYPIANTRIYILDEYFNLCPPFVKGEIAISGISLSTGYVNNPDLTKKSFITGDWGWGNETIYLTGDAGFSNEDCCIFYCGRKDTQVKINGIRIELAEIERQLESIPSVKTATVLIPHQIANDYSIHAYIVASAELDENFLRKSLSSNVPGYMLPEQYHFLDGIPMLHNGKIDRNKLSKMKSEITKEEGPSTICTSNDSSLQLGLLKIWRALLNVEDIHINTNFYDLGGHSQLLPKLKNDIETLTGKTIEFIDLFNYPTIESLTEFILGLSDGNNSGKKGDTRQRFKQLAARNRSRLK